MMRWIAGLMLAVVVATPLAAQTDTVTRVDSIPVWAKTVTRTITVTKVRVDTVRVPSTPVDTVKPPKPPVDTVVAPPPVSGTEPTPSGTILLDWRKGGAEDLGKLTTATLRAAMSKNGNADPSGSWTVVPDYNGQGKPAVRLDWRKTSGETGNTYTYYYPKSVTTVYTSLVIHQGRTATGGGLGNIGQFTTVGGADYGKKQFMWLRRRDDGTDRVYWVWERGAGPSGNTINIDNRDMSLRFTADHGVGQDVRWTFEITAGSPGRVRVWRNGVLVCDQSDSRIGTLPFSESQLSTVRWGVAQDESEYWSDLVMWGN